MDKPLIDIDSVRLSKYQYDSNKYIFIYICTSVERQPLDYFAGSIKLPTDGIENCGKLSVWSEAKGRSNVGWRKLEAARISAQFELCWFSKLDSEQGWNDTRVRTWQEKGFFWSMNETQLYSQSLPAFLIEPVRWSQRQYERFQSYAKKISEATFAGDIVLSIPDDEAAHTIFTTWGAPHRSHNSKPGERARWRLGIWCTIPQLKSTPDSNIRNATLRLFL